LRNVCSAREVATFLADTFVGFERRAVLLEAGIAFSFAPKRVLEFQ